MVYDSAPMVLKMRLAIVFMIIVCIFTAGEVIEAHEEVKKMQKTLSYIKGRVDILDDTVVELYETYSFDVRTLKRIDDKVTHVDMLCEDAKLPKIQQKWSKRK